LTAVDALRTEASPCLPCVVPLTSLRPKPSGHEGCTENRTRSVAPRWWEQAPAGMAPDRSRPPGRSPWARKAAPAQPGRRLARHWQKQAPAGLAPCRSRPGDRSPRAMKAATVRFDDRWHPAGGSKLPLAWYLAARGRRAEALWTREPHRGNPAAVGTARTEASLRLLGTWPFTSVRPKPSGHEGHASAAHDRWRPAGGSKLPPAWHRAVRDRRTEALETRRLSRHDLTAGGTLLGGASSLRRCAVPLAAAGPKPFGPRRSHRDAGRLPSSGPEQLCAA